MNILLHRLTANHFKQLADVDLRFPDRCAFLIEGQNEAGKSSLFEAVFFALYGKTLIADRDYRIEHLKQYGSDEMLVSLEFSVDGRPFSITRRFGKSNTARLVCPGLDGATEVITQTGEVNRRLADELRLSADAALNTCFVEQKRLERLEDMQASVRRDTINELLNLRMLTNLEAEFKLTTDDRSELGRLKRRVGIAELDAHIPEIEDEARAAARCLLFAILLAASAEARDLDEQVSAAAAEISRISGRRAEIARSLEAWSKVTGCVHVIDTDLTHRLSAWQKAIGEHTTALLALQELERLVSTLPERDASLAGWSELLDRLRRMEQLESEAAQMSADVTEERAALDRYDALKSEADRAEIEIGRLARAVVEASAEAAAAKAKSETRQLQIQRLHQLDSWTQRYDAACAAGVEAAALAGLEREARQIADTLPGRRQRAGEMRAIGTKVRQRDDTRQERDRIAVALESARGAEAEARERSARAESLRRGTDALARDIETATAAEQEASTSARTAKLRVTLLEWAEASERSAESGAGAGRVGDLRGKRDGAQERLQTAEAEAKRAARGLAPGLGLAGLGAALLAALIVGLPLLFAVLGGALLIAGTLLAVRSRGAAAQANTARETARSERDTLAGELRAAEAQAQADNSRRAEWTARLIEAAKRLGLLAEPPPSDAAEARARAAGLPATSPGDLDAALTGAIERLRKLRSEYEIAMGMLTSLRAELNRTDPDSLPQTIARLEGTLADIDATLGDLAGLESELAAFGLTDEPSALERAVRRADAEAAEAQAAEKTAAELGDRLRAKEESVSALVSATAASARELGLAGNSAPDWRNSAATERERIDAERLCVPDGALQSALEHARNENTERDRRHTRAEADQKQRQEVLNARQRAEIVEAVDALDKAFATIVEQLDALVDTRPELARSELPATSVELAEALAARRNQLEADHRRAAGLEPARAALQAAEQSISSQAVGFESAWKSTLPDLAAPPDAACAVPALNSARSSLSERAAELNEPALRDEEAQRADEHNRLQRTHAGLERDLGRAQERVRQGRSGLGAGDEPLERLLERFPELRQTGERTIPEWEIERDRTVDRLRVAHSERSVRAVELGLDDEPLDLAVERETHAAEQLRQDVKRAGFDIVRKTRESIVNRVMPLTMHNMERLLPTLTDNRYSQAKWDESENAIMVYDNRARTHLRKHVFSGGARDQISLAMRLSFALATLPGEHSVRPAWLFLDEPLSSFDRQRTQALVDLLTRGLIHKQFPQVFLISHSESFDPGQFDNRLRMEAGRVV